MSINIHTMYVDRDTVCQSAYSMSIGIHLLMYLDRHTVCQLTYSVSIDIHGVYVDRHTVCRSTYYMSIEILYVDRQLFPTDIRITRITYTGTLKHFKQELLSESDVYKATPLLRHRKDATILRFLRHISVFTKFGFRSVINSFIDTDHYR